MMSVWVAYIDKADCRHASHADCAPKYRTDEAPLNFPANCGQPR